MVQNSMLMTKFLLAILLFAFATKVISDSGVLSFKNGTFKLAFIDETGKGEKSDKEEGTKSGKPGPEKEEKYHSHYFAEHVPVNPTGILSFQINHNKPHAGFIIRLYTPPNLL